MVGYNNVIHKILPVIAFTHGSLKNVFVACVLLLCVNHIDLPSDKDQITCSE